MSTTGIELHLLSVSELRSRSLFYFSFEDMKVELFLRTFIQEEECKPKMLRIALPVMNRLLVDEL